jgi:hypothetical protein
MKTIGAISNILKMHEMDNISYATNVSITEIDEMPHLIVKSSLKDDSEHYTLIPLDQFCGELLDGVLNCHDHVKQIVQYKN